MKSRKIWSSIIILSILSYFIVSLIPVGVSKSYAGRVAAQTLTSDINGIDESLYPGYKNLIQSLKNARPNYNFQLYYTGLNWNEVLNAEYQSHGKSPLNLFQAKSNYEGMWYCPICGTRKYDNGSLCCASKEAIAYMIDPRNSINASDVFQFKTLEGSDVSREDIARVVAGKGSFINNDEAIQAIYDASVAYNINGYFLVAKIINEHGNNGSTLTAGNGYNGNYVGYYNYFNLGSYGNGSAAIINNGLSYAKEKGWNSRRASILGGAEAIKNSYITNRGQKTLYYQKFNVVDRKSLFAYQYQANIMAAQSQGSSLKSYYGNAINTKDMTFIIPVYENMPASASPRPDVSKTNTINYENGVVTNVSSSLTVRASGSKSGLAIGKLNNGESIKILSRASSQVDGYFWDLIVSNVDGTYGYAARIVGGDTCISSTGSGGSSSGAAGTQTPNTNPAPSTPSNPGANADVAISGGNIKATPNATYETLKGKYANAVIKNANGQEVTSGNLGTGFTVTIDGNTYTIVKKGDVNGDGSANISDAVTVLNYLRDSNLLNGVKVEAAKVNGQANVTIADAVLLLNYIKGTANIGL